MEVGDMYEDSVIQLQREGRLTDYRAGELRAMYTLRRRLFGVGAIAVVVAFISLHGQAHSWFGAAVVVALFAIPFMYFMSQVVALEHKINRVSERSSDVMDEFLDEFLAPYPELHRLFHKWRAEGPLWRYDEVRLTGVAQMAKIQEKPAPGAAT